MKPLLVPALLLTTAAFAADPPPAAPTNAPVRLPPVVVTGTRNPTSLLETPVRTEVIEAETIALTKSSKLADAVEWVTGLRVESNCQNCNTSEIRMLGLQQRYVSILTDGLATFSGLAGVYGIEQVPAAIIDRIEVVKGGGAALYGPGAVAGVVNIIPRDPQTRQFTLDSTVSRMEGAQSGARPNLDVSGVWEHVPKQGDWGFRVYGLHNYVQGVDVGGDRFTEVTRRDLAGGGIRFVSRPFAGARLVLDYLHTHEFRRGGEDGPGLDAPPNEAFLGEQLRTTRDVGTLQFKHEVDDAFDYQLGFSAANTARESYYGGVAALLYAPPGDPNHNPAVPARLAARFPEFAAALADPAGIFYDPAWTPQLGFGDTDNLLLMTDVSANRRFGTRHTLTYGVQWRHESIRDNQTGLGRVVDDIYDNVGAYAQHDWRISGRWSLLYGGRVDKHSAVADPIFSPRAALKFSPTANLDFRLGVATGFRAPEVFDEDLHIANVGGALEVITLSPGLREESSVTYTLGPDWRINEDWRFEGNLFYTRIADVFFNDPASDDPATPSIIESTKINSGRASVHGAELNLSYRCGAFQGELGYVEQRNRYGTPQLLIGTPGDPVDNPVFSRNFERTPRRYGVVKLAYDTGRWSAFLGGKLTGPMEVPHNLNDPLTGARVRNELARSPWFFAVDFGLTYAWQLAPQSRLTASAGVKNLFNTYQDDLDGGPFRDTAYIYGPRFPRTPYFGLKLTF